MSRRRTTARGALLLLVATLLTGSAAARSGAPAQVPRLVFPVVGQVTYQDDFGDPRGSRSHQGNDLMAPRKALAVAAEAGTVEFWTTSASAGCMLYLKGESGTTYLYIHLNNDLGAGNDNKGRCVPGVSYAKGLKDGARVAAGEVVGYVGDSGDADGISPHLHFELHPAGKGAVNPFPRLRRAQRLLFAAKEGSTFSLALSGKVVAAGLGKLAVSVERVRTWPGGRRIAQDGRKVEVSVPDTATLETASPALPATPSLDALLAGTAVTVFTAPGTVTPAARAGAKGVLAAQRVVVTKLGA